ncbi:MAG: endonuclease V [Candidatus Thorarchaeota archaeon]
MSILYELLRDDYSFEEAKSLQYKFQKLIKTREENKISHFESIKTIAGVDVSYYSRENVEYGVACAILWNIHQEKMETCSFAQEKINFPYKAGFLGFRECKVLASAILKLPKTPEIILCDGHGIIHPRKFGEAVHLGFALNISSIGIAKNPYFGYSDWQGIKKIKGSKSKVWTKDPKNIQKKSSNEFLGYAICLNNGSKPVFISEGYKISLDFALKICLATTKNHRQPEPLYLADHLSREELNNYI